MTLGRARALAVLGIMALIAITAVVWTITRDTQDDSAKATNTCTHQALATEVPKPDRVKLRILNATDRGGLATTTADALKERGFNVLEAANSPDDLIGTAEVRFGGKAVGAAQLVRAQIPAAQSIADDRQDDVVVLVLGPKFTNLTSERGVNNALSTLGKPVLPKPACG